MVYPSCLVLLPLSDLPAVVPQGSANTPGGQCSAQQGQAAHRDPAISSVTLTPPTSPEEAHTGKTWTCRVTRNKNTRTRVYLKILFFFFFFFLFFSFFGLPSDYQPSHRWLKLSSASDCYSSNNTLHGGKIPRRLASQMVESVWQEYNINRTGNKYVQCPLFQRLSISHQSCISVPTDKMSVRLIYQEKVYNLDKRGL